jgi:N-acyl-D-aspartate/D-glutamate deacylase
MEDARQAGIDVTCDVYPYTATSFNLSAMLPPWAHEDGFDAVLNRLQDNAVRARLQSDMITGLPAWPSPLAQTPWDQVMIASAPTHPAYEGKTVQSLSHDTGVDPFTLVFDLLVTEQLSASVIRFALHEKDVQMVLQSPFSMIGSDGSALAVTGSLGMGKPHPRNYGTFPRVLHRYVRERAVLTWPEAIRKMTSFPAQKLQVWNRGVIRVGAWADLVVLDPPTIADTATFQHPHQYPHGIDYVIVNGIIVIDQQDHRNRFPGQILKRTALAS